MKSDFIKLENCINGCFYFIDARNFEYGIFVEKQKGFWGIRNKFNDTFLDLEFHWDTGEPYGTAKPLKLMGFYPNKLPVRCDFCKEIYNAMFKFLTKIKEEGKNYER